MLRTITALTTPMAGHIIIYIGDDGQGTDLTALSAAELSRLIGIVLTERTDLRNMTVKETVALGRSPYTDFWGRLTPYDRQVADAAIEVVGIAALAQRKVRTLSDGERQRMMIAKAIAQQTPIIILDEPTAFLDYPGRVETMRLLSRLAHDEGKTILLSTHDMEIASHYADMFWVMNGGTLRAGTRATVEADSSRDLVFDDSFYDRWIVTHL